MENVLILSSRMSETVLFRYGTIIKELNREKLSDFLIKKSLKSCSSKLFHNSTLKSFYQDAYDFIIKHLDEIDFIQVYQDNAIRLQNILNSSELIIFEDYDFCNDEMTSAMLKELLTFVKLN